MDELAKLIVDLTDAAYSYRDRFIDLENKVSSLESMVTFSVILHFITIVLILLFVKRNNDKNNKL